MARLLLLLLGVAALPARAQVVINEIMYNSPGDPDVEFVELYNAGATSQDLAGWTLLDDDDMHDRAPLSGVLGPGEYLVVAGDLTLFGAFYPLVENVNPAPFDSQQPGEGFGLGNGGDTVRLFDAQSNLVDEVAYDDGGAWPSAAAGDGPSLELIHPGLDNAVAGSWGTSTLPPPQGTPGAQNANFDPDTPPAIGVVTRDPALPTASDVVTIVADVVDDVAVVTADLHVDVGAGFVPRPMAPDGSLRTAEIDPEPSGTLVRYWIRVVDSVGQEARFPAGAPAEYVAYTVDHRVPDLTIHELVASNQTGAVDEFGEADDWIEIRNRGPHAVDLGGMFLSDSLTEPQVWELPPTVLGPGERVVVWCDESPNQGPLHATFNLAKEGGEVALWDSVDHGNVRVHGLRFGPQAEDVAFGYLPDDADAPEYLAVPSPGTSNDGSPPFSTVCINEFLAGSQLPGHQDWIELYNRGGATANLGDWILSDGSNEYVFPNPTLLAPGDYLLVEESTFGFGLSLSGADVIQLTDGTGSIGMDYYDFGPQLPDVSEGRFADGTAYWHSFSATSADAPNTCGASGPSLAPVPGLRFADPVTPAWDPLASATAYDVVRGSLALLGAGFATAVDTCRDDNRQGTLSFDPEAPDPGNAWFYLVRGVTNACAFGSYGTVSGGESAPRDAEIAASPSACP